jgi:hypothetical protein
MARYLVGLAVTLLVGAPLCAGELDREFATKASPDQKTTVAPAKAKTATTAALPKTSELDSETPADAGRAWRGGGWRGGWGGGWHGGWGFGWRGGWGRGWGGWGRGWGVGWRGGWGWGGWGGGWGVGWGGGWGGGFWPRTSFVSVGFGSPGWGGCWW